MLAADQNDLKPSIGCTIFLIARWSCSTMLFRYFVRRSSMSAPESARMFLIAAVLAPLLSILIFSGTPLRSMSTPTRGRSDAELALEHSVHVLQRREASALCHL